MGIREGSPPISGRTAATTGSASTYRSRASNASRPRQEPKSAKCCCCCSLPVCLLIFLILAAVGGVLVWKFLPKKTVKLPFGSSTTGAESSASTFQWNELCNGSTTDCCNGVPGLCSLRPNDILFGSLHNAQASVDNGWLVAGNQEYNLAKALVAGYRGLNVDVGMCNGQLRMIHGYCQLGSFDPAEAWVNMTKFLQNNPNEVLLVTIENVHQNDEANVTLDAIEASMPQSFLNLLYTGNPTTEFPTLQELIDMGQRILLFHYAGQSCSEVTCPPGFHEWFYYGTETKFEISNVNDVTCPLDRGSNGIQDFYAINDFVTDPLPSRTAAQTLNSKSFLENLISNCSKMENRDVNLIFIDFWNEGDLVEVQQRHNLALVQQQQRSGNSTSRQGSGNSTSRHLLRSPGWASRLLGQ